MRNFATHQLPRRIEKCRSGCPIIKGIPPVELLNEGRVRRVRGVAWTSKVSPQYAPMMIDSCRSVLNPYLADVWVFTDAAKKLPKEARGGYGLSLVAETESGALISADAMSEAEASSLHTVTEPSALGKEIDVTSSPPSERSSSNILQASSHAS
mmetsp:Transcript_22733/g.18806  ORF Transcript_22733/g.18806 Transcript_22733/m.18806 type:complete len:154 (+) Transcript_22733:283-744(+)